MLSNVRYLNAERTWIGADSDGRVVSVPVDAANSDYAGLLAAGTAIGPFVLPPPTAEDVRSECRRRMRLALGARDDGHLDVLISNAAREGIRLLRKGAVNWTPEEKARAAQLEGADLLIERLRAASNALEAAPPADFASDARWSAPEAT